VRSLTFVEPGRLEWREADAPTLQGPGEALVRPTAVAACDLDGLVVRGAVPIPGPYAFGHELAGEVVDAGDAVTTVRPGDRVVLSFQVFCGTCGRCRRGLTANCEGEGVNYRAMYGFGPLGGMGWGGAFSDLVRVPFADAMLFPVPDGVETATVATASDNITDGWRRVGPALEGEHAGAEVLVVGGGAPSIGLYAVDAARALGAARVVYIDPSEERRSAAEAYGAETIGELPERKAGRFGVTVDASGSEAGLHVALRSTAPGGVCESVGIYYAPTPMPLLEMYDAGITFVTGRPHVGPMLPRVLDLIAAGRIDPDRIRTTAGWDEAPSALLDPPTKLVFTRE
jgi:alcohol dehydrogenase